MTTLLPKDADNNIIPVMGLKNGGAHTLAATSVSTRNTIAFDGVTKVVSLYATGAVYLKFGNASVTAGNADHYFPAGIYYDFAISGGGTKGPHTPYLAVLAAGSNCTLHISERE